MAGPGEGARAPTRGAGWNRRAPGGWGAAAAGAGGGGAAAASARPGPPYVTSGQPRPSAPPPGPGSGRLKLSESSPRLRLARQFQRWKGPWSPQASSTPVRSLELNQQPERSREKPTTLRNGPPPPSSVAGRRALVCCVQRTLGSGLALGNLSSLGCVHHPPGEGGGNSVQISSSFLLSSQLPARDLERSRWFSDRRLSSGVRHRWRKMCFMVP